MVEELMYQKKQERKHMWRCVLSCFVGVLLFAVVGAFLIWTEEIVRNSSVTYVVRGRYLGIMGILGIVFILGIVILIGFLIISSREKCEKEIQKFQFHAKEDEFFQLLGGKEIEIRLKNINFYGVPKRFSKTIINPNVKYYVQKSYLKKLHIRAFQKYENGAKEKIWDCDTDDYAFFFEWFEPIFEPRENDD